MLCKQRRQIRRRHRPGEKITLALLAAVAAQVVGLRLGFEYAATERTSIGAKANFDNAYQYDQGTILLFLKSAFN